MEKNFHGILLTTTNIVEGGGQDLFNEAWTMGDLNSISDIVGILGNAAMTIISFVGFAIVVFSILKNAMSGLYVVNPEFWDKVDQLKQDAKNGIQGATSGGNAAAQKLGGLFTYLLGLMPNIRALTDFEDGADIDKKQYFLKSIPLLVAQIFIGMLIFFGYPSKIANWIGTGATYAIDVVMKNADPVTIISGVSDMFIDIKLATDGSNDPTEQLVNNASREAISTVNSKYSDMEKESLQTVAYEIEAHLMDILSGTPVVKETITGTGYTVSITSSYSNTQPKYSDGYKDVTGDGADYIKMSTASNGEVTFFAWMPVASMSTGSLMTQPNDHVIWRIRCTPQAVTMSSVAKINIYGQIGVAKSAQGFDQLVVGPEYGNDSAGQFSGNLGAVTVTIHTTGNRSFDAVGKLERAGGITSASNRVKLVLPDGSITDLALDNGEKINYIDITPQAGMTVFAQDSNSVKHTYDLGMLRLEYLASSSDPSTNRTYALTSWVNYDSNWTKGIDITKIAGSTGSKTEEKGEGAVVTPTTPPGE